MPSQKITTIEKWLIKLGWSKSGGSGNPGKLFLMAIDPDKTGVDVQNQITDVYESPMTFFPFGNVGVTMNAGRFTISNAEDYGIYSITLSTVSRVDNGGKNPFFMNFKITNGGVQLFYFYNNGHASNFFTYSPSSITAALDGSEFFLEVEISNQNLTTSADPNDIFDLSSFDGVIVFTKIADLPV